MFETLDALPADPILGLSTAYKNDSRAKKIDLGVGVFKDETGNTPIMRSVKEAEIIYLRGETTKVYTPPAGYPGFINAVANMVFGSEFEGLNQGKIAGVLTPGGSGALRLGGELITRRGANRVFIGSPTWGNHIPLLKTAGLTIETMPYYDKDNVELLFDAFCDTLRTLGPEDTVLLHGACHNPSGQDLSPGQWDIVADIAAERGFLPFIDTAYHGLAKGIEEDLLPIRRLASKVPEILLAYSCSKNFGLYRERTGAIMLLAKSNRDASAAQSHLENIARVTYSMPPAHGGALVTTILESNELTKLWHDELNAMRDNVAGKRRQLDQCASANGLGVSFNFIPTQNGMFSLLPIKPDQVETLKNDFGIYMTSGGRINICGFSAENMDHFCKAYKSVL